MSSKNKQYKENPRVLRMVKEGIDGYTERWKVVIKKLRLIKARNYERRDSL